ncbi:MAG: response regulator [Cyanobacteria bacterium J06626_6]
MPFPTQSPTAQSFSARSFSAQPSQAETFGADILVVDDTPDNLRLLLSVLGKQGYRVRPVTQGLLAITAAQLDPPDLILLDIKMPDMDGYEVCRRLKGDPRTRHVPVIFLTVLDDVVDIVKGFELGGIDYITKPVRTDELLVRIDNQIKIQLLQKQLSAQELFLRTIYNGIEAAVSVIDVPDTAGVAERGERAGGDSAGHDLERQPLTIINVNEAFLRMTGLSRSQLEGADVRRFVSSEIVRSHHLACIETGEPITHEDTVELHGKLTWWLSTHTPLRNDQGRVYRLIGTSLEITDRKQAETQLAKRTEELSQALESLKAAQSDLIRSAKMAALGNLVAGVAHEINTPVGTAIMTASTLENASRDITTELAKGELKRSSFESYLEVATECSHLILNNLQRAGELIHSFKQVAVDQSSLQKRTFELKTYVQEVITNLRPQIKSSSHCVRLSGKDEITILSYPGAIAQIITNLIINSLTHAFPDDEPGQITIDITQDSALTTLRYHDDGCGISETDQSRIFEPFFTTAREKGGSGLGLHLIYNLVTQKLKGDIRVASEEGQGTTFTITLPNQLETPDPIE